MPSSERHGKQGTLEASFIGRCVRVDTHRARSARSTEATVPVSANSRFIDTWWGYGVDFDTSVEHVEIKSLFRHDCGMCRNYRPDGLDRKTDKKGSIAKNGIKTSKKSTVPSGFKP